MAFLVLFAILAAARDLTLSGSAVFTLRAGSTHETGFRITPRLSQGVYARVPAPAFLIKELVPPRALALLFSWDKAAQDSRSAGFAPDKGACCTTSGTRCKCTYVSCTPSGAFAPWMPSL